MSDLVSFTIEVDMEKRWVPHFLGMLQSMEHLGRLGLSRALTFFSDGDGDFHPRFKWNIEAQPIQPGEEYSWDAG
jgi:hypothetical protein